MVPHGHKVLHVLAQYNAHNEVVQKGEPLQTVSACALEHVGSSIHRKMVGVVGQVG